MRLQAGLQKRLKAALHTSALVLAAGGLAGCAAPAGPAALPAELVFSRPLVLLGEVHDNAAQHALRLRAFEAWLATGARPALLMEQFDRERQGEIDRLRARQPAPDAHALTTAVGGSGWQWAFYEPFIALALQHGLPIVAVNVSRDDARAVMRQGLAATGFDPAVPADIEAALARQVRDSHCGMVDEPLSRRMALAQVARDQFMAAQVQQFAGRGVLLLAGNGHVRTDLAVPRWLSPATRARSQAIGLLEAGDPGAAAFDRVLTTPAQPRPDPCAGMTPPAAPASPATR